MMARRTRTRSRVGSFSNVAQRSASPSSSMSLLDEREKMSFRPLRHTEPPLSRRMLDTFRISPDGSIAGRMYEYDDVVVDRQLVSESKG